MIITLLGGSAQSTPVLADALARVALTSISLRLAGRHPDRTQAVARACRVLCERGAVGVDHFTFDNWSAAIEGSDVIVVQVRIGGYEGRAFDERFPLDSGVPGDEGLGPGGLSAAYRSWPQLSRWLGRIRSLAPSSRIILLTSPGSLLVRLAAATVPELDLVHVCELPATTLQRLSEEVGESASHVTFDYVGVNHLGWLFNLRSERGDLLARYVASHKGREFPDAELIAELGAFPLKYLRLFYRRQETVHLQRIRTDSRSAQLVSIADRAFEVFRTGDAKEIRAALALRPADWYEEAVIPLLQAYMGAAVGAPLFLTNAGRTPDIAERRYRAAGGTLEEIPPEAAPPRSVMTLLAAFKNYERLAADAVLEGSERTLTLALSALPWETDDLSARRMARQIIRNSYAQRGQPLVGSYA